MNIAYIQKNKRDWRPPEPFQIFTKFQEIRIDMRPHISMRFNYEYEKDGITLIDEDWNDWKKVGGISLADFFWNFFNIFNKSRDAILLGWRYNVELKIFEFAIYINEQRAFKVYDQPAQLLRVIAGTEIRMTIRRRTNRREYAVYLHLKSREAETVNPIVVTSRKKFTLFSRVGLWYGGANNAPGPWGGRAPKDMTTEYDWKRI